MSPFILKLVHATVFATLTLLATALLVGMLGVIFGWSDGTGTALLALIFALPLIYILRASLPRLSLARGLMVSAAGLMTVPVQAALIVYLGIVDVAAMDQQSGLPGIVARLNLWMTSGSIALWAAGLSITVAPVMFIFGWAFATKGPED